MQSEKQYTVLFLDDEANILRAMKRLFHGRKHRLVLVDDGNKALKFMQDNVVHVVVSDMKMPAMKGEDFLESVADSYPETYRIVLSGYTEPESLLHAVNKGRIHRFLKKPWNNEALIEAIEDGINTFKLKHDNELLQAKLKSQNKRLALLNSSLEERVELRTLQIKTAIKRADMDVLATKKVLFNTLSSVPHIKGDNAKKVSELAKRIAQKMNLESTVVEDITYAAIMGELGMISLDESIYKTPYTKLPPKDQLQYNNQGNNALLILSPAGQLKSVSDIIVNQFEHFNGKGYPNQLSGDEIPIGAQILSVARDFYRYSTGMVDGEAYNQKVVLAKLNNFADLQYSKAILNILSGLVSVAAKPKEDDGLTSADLREGMVLTDAIYNDKDILIMPQGQTLDAANIAKLKDLEKRFDFKLTIFAK